MEEKYFISRLKLTKILRYLKVSSRIWLPKYKKKVYTVIPNIFLPTNESTKYTMLLKMLSA